LGNWDEATMAFQRKNGSLFNSPATTAAAAIHSYDRRAVQYLDSLVSLFGSSGAVQKHQQQRVQSPDGDTLVLDCWL
jgi:hypothetical protein